MVDAAHGAIPVIQAAPAAPQIGRWVHARRQALLLRHPERGLRARRRRLLLRQRVVRDQVVRCGGLFQFSMLNYLSMFVMVTDYLD